MTAPLMDPQYEQRLRDEVIYLHSLWHQGPPRAADPADRHHLQPSKTTKFKKEKKRKGKSGKISKNKPYDAAPESNSSPAEWSVPSPPPQTSTNGWPTPEAKPERKPLSLSPEEKSKLAAKHAHQNALKVVQEFFRSNNADDSDAGSSDEDDGLMEGDNGCKEYSFFLKVFEEDSELREHYEKNFAKGEFNCLVCGAMGGKKTGKMFKGCLALVQHSITIAKTKKKRAHRALGQAVCKVLGWEIGQLPTIVSMLSDKSGEAQGNVTTDNKESSMTFVNNIDSIEGNNGETVPESGSIGTGILCHRDGGDVNFLMSPDAGKNLEDFGMVHAHNLEETAAEGLASNSLMCPDADENLENLGVMHLHNVEEPAAQGSTSNSLMCPDAGKNLEDFGMVHAHNVEETAVEGLASNTLTCPDADKNSENLGMVHSHNVEEPAAPGLISMLLCVGAFC